MKNDTIHIFIFAVLVANFELASFSPKQKYTFPWKWSVLQNPERERTIGTWTCLRLALPYNTLLVNF